MKFFLGIALFFVSFSISAQWQAQAPQSSGEIFLKIKKLRVLGSVLYVAAHPDDENTRMLSWLANDQLLETNYLSLTRGDGGQNLIGQELSEKLGLIRTQELLAARKVDGAKQWFTRANDFGYSKNPEETFTIWNKDSLLADVVLAIRKFRPDVIVTRFSPKPSNTHGHHTASAMLAVEAAQLANQANMYPHHFQLFPAYAPKRVYWNTSWWFYGREDFDKTGLLQLDVGAFNPLLGSSYGEIASASRSQHKSQGFGAARQRGSEMEYLMPLWGDTNQVDQLFQGIETSWKRVVNGAQVDAFLKQAEQKFNHERPYEVLPLLLDAYQIIQKLKEKASEADLYYLNLKEEELRLVILACSGVHFEVVANQYSYQRGDSLKTNVLVVNRSPVVMSTEAELLAGKTSSIKKIKIEQLANNQMSKQELLAKIPADMPFSNPYWLNDNASVGSYFVPDLALVGKPEADPYLQVRFDFSFPHKGKTIVISAERPVLYKWTDPVKGELYRNLEVLPPVSIQVLEDNVWMQGQEAMVKVKLRANAPNVNGSVFLVHPEVLSSGTEKFSFNKAGEEKYFSLPVQLLSPGNGVYNLEVVAETNLGTSELSLYRIEYDHIPIQVLQSKAKVRLLANQIEPVSGKVAYVQGAGDDVDKFLKQVGYSVEVLTLDQVKMMDLSSFKTLVFGIRSWNTLADIGAAMDKVNRFAFNGGAVIVQYNTSGGLKSEQFGPYKLKITRNRVTNENSPIKLLNTSASVLNSPHKIEMSDFNDWVQERGLYFPEPLDTALMPLLVLNDPGEAPQSNAVLYANYGKGVYVYTGISFFRQLPAGVPGAAKLFINFVEAGKAAGVTVIPSNENLNPKKSSRKSSKAAKP